MSTVSSKHTVIKSASELHCGDHVSWPSSFSVVRHHAIAIAHKGGNIIKVVHVIPKEDEPTEYEVREECIDLADYTTKGWLWRYEYTPEECYEPKEVVDRALEKKGKFDYDAMKNNCEHFARWCKTGDLQSKQADTAKKVGEATTASFAAAVGAALVALIADIARR